MDKIITKRTWVLSIMVLLGLSLVWLIPNTGVFRESMLTNALPEKLNGLDGEELKITKEERDVLADDTTFARKRYKSLTDNSKPPMDISVVFSGKDINNSLHRPEICLRAQGWNFLTEKYIVLEGLLPDGSDLPMKKIVCEQKLEDGSLIKKVQLYTLFGSEVVVSGHYDRTFEDIKARLLKGTDQQWAYATFSISDTVHYRDLYGELVKEKIEIQQCEETLKQFITDSVPHLVSDKGE